MTANPQLAALIAELRAVLDKYSGPTMGAHYAAAFPASGSLPPARPDGSPSPLMAMLGYDAQLATAMPLPPARGTGVFAVEGPNGELPSRIGTPGATNPDVTDDPAVLKATIGTPGWTAQVRPPVSYTNALKIQVMSEYGIIGNPTDFELDHLVPLCCGGNPISQLNLWAQRRAGVNGASLKDTTEVAAQHAILNGHMSLADVQRGFCEDWTKLHAALFSNPAVVRGLLAMAMEPPPEEP
jgi:hypothetical protein